MLYTGPMQYHLMDKEVIRAFRSWGKQRARCYNKKQNGYKNYGEKGIKVEYSAREFIGWWTENIKDFKGEKPTIGRIDHSKNYSFKNVFIQGRRENSLEVYERTGNVPIKPKEVLVYKNKKLICVCESTRKASILAGCSQQYVSMICKKKRKETKKGFNFKFRGE